MNRYILIDLKDNVLYSIEKVEIDFEENKSQTSSETFTNKIELIEEAIKELIEEKEIIEKEAKRKL